jgi:hypothetical protein
MFVACWIYRAEKKDKKNMWYWFNPFSLKRSLGFIVNKEKCIVFCFLVWVFLVDVPLGVFIEILGTGYLEGGNDFCPELEVV